MLEAKKTPLSHGPEPKTLSSHVLVVEDDPDYALLVVDALENGDRFAVDVAATAEDARSRGFDRFGAIVLDHNLPDAIGLELLPEIVGSCETPVVMLTGENVVETAVESIRAGAFSYLVKSAENLEVLPEIVGQAVEEARRRRERQEMLAQMRRAENLASLGTLAAGMCHEMNNPLAAITGYADMYLRGLENDARKSMETILTAACRLRDVVKSLASFASGSEPPQEKVNLVAAVREELEQEKQALSETGIRVVLESPLEPVEATGNWPRLRHVIHHLVRNARQAVENAEEKTVTVRVSCRGDYVRIEVEDTGLGVPPEVQGRIFDPFFTTRDPGQGMGMGLAISHRIIDEHRGRMQYEPGRSGGAIFVVEIPAAGPGLANGQQLRSSAERPGAKS